MSTEQSYSLSRRTFIQGTVATAVASPWFSELEAAVENRWNILWLTAEDLSPDLGCYGDAWARTPNLDCLAAEGALYTNAFSVAPVCAPSRSCIITGMYPTAIGTHHMRCKGVPPSYVKCFTEYLRAAGYYCSNNVKTDYNFDPPLTAWDESSRTAHWKKRAPGQPFFSVFNHTVTHESQIRLSDEEFAKRTELLTADERHHPEEAVVPPYYPNTAATRRDWARYYDLISVLDKQIGERLRELENDGLRENTVVFFFGDHGRGLPRGKRWLYDAGLKVPLMIRWPGMVQQNTRIEAMTSFIDLAPTVLSIADVDIPRYMQGRAFLGDRADEPREYIYAARDRMDEAVDMSRCVRDKQFLYIKNYQACKPYAQYIDYMEQMPTMKEMRVMNKQGTLEGPQMLFFLPEKPEEELYDTLADPHQIHNLAAIPEYRETLERLRRVHLQWKEETHDLGEIKEEVLWEQMRPGGEWSVTADPTFHMDESVASGAVTVEIACTTEGASIAYTTEEGENVHWNLYTQPIRLTNSGILRMKACRLGYKDSAEVATRIMLNDK